MYLKYLLCLIVPVFISTTFYAQDSTLTLKQTLQAVVSNYPSIKAKAALAKGSEYNVAAQQKDYLPDFIVADQYNYATANGLQGSYYSNGGTSISTSGGVHDANIYNGIFGSFTTLMVDWHAFDFGKVKQNVTYAKARERVYDADYRNEIFRQQITAADIYLQLSLSQKLIAVQQENLQRAESFHSYVTARALNGLVAGVDTSYSNAQVANAQISLLQVQQRVAQQKIQLAALSGLPEAELNPDVNTFLNSVPAILTDNFSVENNPEEVLASKQVAAEKERSLVIKKSASPTINVLGIGWARGSGINNAGGDYSDKISDGIPYQTYNYMAALALNWNITSLFKTKQQYRAAQQVAASSQFDLDEETIKLKSELSTAKLQYSYALQQAKLAPFQYQSAFAAYTQSNARYKAGLAALPELVQALYTLNQAEVDEAVANNNAWRSLLQQAAATGNLEIFLQQLPQ